MPSWWSGCSIPDLRSGQISLRRAGTEGDSAGCLESVMREVVGDRTVDEVITWPAGDGIGSVDQDAGALNQIRMGIASIRCNEEYHPPSRCRRRSTRSPAQQEKENSSTKRGAITQVIPLAEGERISGIREADGYRLKRIMSRGRCRRFRALWPNTSRPLEVTRRRIYIETLQDVMPSVRSRSLSMSGRAHSAVPESRLPEGRLPERIPEGRSAMKTPSSSLFWPLF